MLKSVRNDHPVVSAGGVVLVAVLVALLLQFLRGAPAPRPTAVDALRTALEYFAQSAAPYLLVPFLAGLTQRRLGGGLLLGVLGAWILVAGYYGWFVPSSFADQRGTLAEKVFWLIGAVVAGVIGACLGHLTALRSALAYVMPVALVLEPLVWTALTQARVAPVLAQPQNVAGAVVEALVGIGWALSIRRSGWTHPSARRSHLDDRPARLRGPRNLPSRRP